MRVLVTGGAGFIGSHLAERLLGDGAEVTVVDNLSTGSLRNIEGFRGEAGFEFVEGDICDAVLMEKLVARCEAIYHLAAAVGVNLIAEEPVRTIETNIGGTEAVLEVANKFGTRVFIASSSEVYGKNESAPFGEDDDIVLGSTRLSRWSYACSKAIDEFLGFAFHQQYGLGVIIARFFNTIGPRQTGRYGMVVPRFVERALKNEPVLIYGTGKQSRCFGYVGDVVDAIVGLMNCDRAVGQVYNVGGGPSNTLSLFELVLMLRTATGQEINPAMADWRSGDQRVFVADIRKAKSELGWRPCITPREGVNRLVDWTRASEDLLHTVLD